MLLNIQSETDAFLVAIRPDGSQKWRAAISDLLDVFRQSSPAIDPNGNIYIAAGQDAYIFNSSGQLVAAVSNIGDTTGTSPAIDDTGRAYFVGGSKIYCWFLVGNSLQTCSGWQDGVTLPIGSDVGTPAIGNDGTIYVQTNAALIALSPNGVVKWTLSGPDIASPVFRYLSPAIAPDGTIYAVHPTGGAVFPSLFAIRDLVSSAQVLWTSLNQGAGRSNVLVDKDGTIFVSDGNFLNVINPENGLIIERISVFNNRSSPALDVDGSIYIGESSGLAVLR